MKNENDVGNSARCLVGTVEVPLELWQRVRGVIFRLPTSPVRYAGGAAYDVGLCDKARVDALVKDVRAIPFNATAKRGYVEADGCADSSEDKS